MAELRDMIEKRLNDLGIGAVAAAERAGLERSYIRDFLKGRKRTFNQNKLKKLAFALGCDVADFFEESPLKDFSDKKPDSDRRRWNQIFDAASPAERQQMLAFLASWIPKNRKG